MQANNSSELPNRKCPVLNCDGKGNTNGKFIRHYSIKFCPNVKQDQKLELNQNDLTTLREKILSMQNQMLKERDKFKVYGF